MDTLKAEKRSMETKAKRLRREGYVTGNVFGHDIEGSIPVKIAKNDAENILKKKKKWQSLKLNGKLTLTISLRSLPKLQVITMPPLLGVAPIMPNVVISGWYRRTMNNLVYSLSKYNIH